MKHLARNVALLSAAAILALGTPGVNSQNKKWRENCADPQTCPDQQFHRSEQDEQSSTGDRMRKDEQAEGEQQSSRKRRVGDVESEMQSVETPRQSTEAPGKPRRRPAQSEADWRFDAKKHERRRKRDDRFRFEFGGFWYPEPYWWYDYGYNPPYRISCGEGRALLFDRGFRRVRTLECHGRIYTYLARRRGEVYRIQVNSRTGRILSVRPA